MQFTAKDIIQATENFADSRKLGNGGFGVVFKGWINSSHVAIKKLTEVRLIKVIVNKSIDDKSITS